jgi:gliding motility-associated-like protein
VKKLLSIFIFLGLLIPNTKATHIVGGELNYLYLGNNNYEIRLTVYRDCFNGVPPFDNPAALGVFDTNNVLLQNIMMSFISLDTLPITINSPCVIPPTNVCYEVTTYIDTINLPPIPGGYQLAYQRCCRNITILNIVSPNATGATYYATIPDTNVEVVNSNPIFNDWPPPFICSQVPFQFDHSATDPEGDSLYYELFQPFHGANQTNPMPQPPNNPPYPMVVWNPPYSTLDMLGGAVPLSINSTTGELIATPGPLGQFVVGIKVSEYRNGVFLSETKRDFQFNVVPCGNITVAALVAPDFSCESFTANFVNNSVGAGSYIWDFGDPTTTSDTSSAVTPSYTYPDTGTYTVMLIAFSSINPACNDTSFGTVTILPEFVLNMNYTNVPCTQDVAFTSSTYLDTLGAVIYDWDFGDPNTTSDTSSLMNPNYTYLDTGTYTVTLIAYSPANIGCNDTNTITVTVFPAFNLNASFNDNPCSGDVSFSGSSTFDNLFGVNYFWDFGDQTILTDTSSLSNPNYTYLNTGTFTATLIAFSDSPACGDSTQLTVTIYPEFVSNMNYVNELCTQFVQFSSSTTLDGITPVNYSWNFGDPATLNDTSSFINPNYTYQDSGTYIVTLISYSPNLNGCSDTISVVVPVFLDFTANSSFVNLTCSPDVNFTGSSSYDGINNVNYVWDFGVQPIVTDTSSLSNPNYTYLSPGTYNPIMIAYTDSPACGDTTLMTITIYPGFESSYSLIEKRCTQEVEFNASTSLDGLITTNYVWDFGDGQSSSEQNPSHTYLTGGIYDIVLNVNTANGCQDKYEKTLMKDNLSEIFIPNAFTPNGDRENDVLYVRGTLDEMTLSIYDRWGEKVFETIDQAIGWDGTYKGNLVEPGVFVYHLTTKCEDSETVFKKGNVTVIR